ncbi:MAG: alpha/beta hydrolase family protein, partial [Acidimicrobiia bacterium]
ANTDGGDEIQLTNFGRALSSKVKLLSQRRFSATSRDGSEVEAWVIPPVGMKKGKKYPALLNIHGGPFSQYGNRLSDEFQIYAASGYAVIYSNPRGSSGYSEAWGRAIRGPQAEDPGTGWGGVDYEDLMAVVDEAIKRFSFIDPQKLGVMGGSYGGYMTSWIVGHTSRFKAACSERACNNMYTMSWTSDIGHFFQSYVGASHLDDADEYLRQSPITYAGQIETPLLIIHSERDLRCPIEQGEQMFVALRMRKKEVEFVRFPGSSHELSRSGSPYQRSERFKVILKFFDRHLK